VNAEIARASRAAELGVSARVMLKGLAIGDRVRVVVTAQQPLPPEAGLRLRLVHPGRRDEDRTAMLSLIETAGDRRSAVFVGEWSSGPSGAPAQAVAWQAVVETRDWRLDDSFTAGGAGEFTLGTR
jgi:hypothetical protein